jgi:serine/threonine protein kinase
VKAETEFGNNDGAEQTAGTPEVQSPVPSVDLAATQPAEPMAHAIVQGAEAKTGQAPEPSARSSGSRQRRSGAVSKDDALIQKKDAALKIRAAEILLATGRSLAECHKAGVLHRDVKPQNLILAPDGKVVKVIDFGLSKDMQAVEPDDVALRMAAAEANTAAAAAKDHRVSIAMEPRDQKGVPHGGSASLIVGTPRYGRLIAHHPDYRSEEQSGKTGPTIDVYGLGIFAHQLLTGHYPNDLDPRDVKWALESGGASSPENAERMALHMLMDRNGRGVYDDPDTGDQKMNYILAKSLAHPVSRLSGGLRRAIFEGKPSPVPFYVRVNANAQVIEQYDDDTLIQDLEDYLAGRELRSAPKRRGFWGLRHADYTVLKIDYTQLAALRQQLNRKNRVLIAARSLGAFFAAIVIGLLFWLGVPQGIIHAIKNRLKPVPAVDTDSQGVTELTPVPAKHVPQIDILSKQPMVTHNPNELTVDLEIDGKPRTEKIALSNLPDGFHTVKHVVSVESAENGETLYKEIEISFLVDTLPQPKTGNWEWVGGLKNMIGVRPDLNKDPEGVYHEVPNAENDGSDKLGYVATHDTEGPFTGSINGYRRTVIEGQHRGRQMYWLFFNPREQAFFSSPDVRQTLTAQFRLQPSQDARDFINGAAAIGFLDLDSGALREGRTPDPQLSYAVIMGGKREIQAVNQLPFRPGEMKAGADYFDVIAKPPLLQEWGSVNPFLKPVEYRDARGNPVKEYVADLVVDKPFRGEEVAITRLVKKGGKWVPTVTRKAYDGRTLIVSLMANVDGKPMRICVGELLLNQKRESVCNFGFFLSGYAGVAKFLNVHVDTKVRHSEATSNRTEMRVVPEVRSPRRRRDWPRQIIRAAVAPRGEATVFLPLSLIDSFIGENFIPSGAGLVFVAEEGEDVRTLEAIYKPLMTIDHFCIVKSNVALAGIDPGDKKGQTALKNLRSRAAHKFGMTEYAMGRPVFINDEYQFGLAGRDLSRKDHLFMKADKVRLAKDPAYRMAYLMTASCLSKQAAAWISGLTYNEKNMIILSDYLIRAFQRDQANLNELARSA